VEKEEVRVLTWEDGAGDAQILANTKVLVEAMAKVASKRNATWHHAAASTTQGTADSARLQTIISCAREDCGVVPRVLENELSLRLSRPFAVSETHAKDDHGQPLPISAALLGVAQRVERSSACILLLTRSLLQQPICLMEAYLALQSHKNLITIMLTDCGYDFDRDKVKSALTDTIKELVKDDEALSAVGCPPQSAQHLINVLLDALTYRIAIPWQPISSEYHISALADEVRKRLGPVMDQGSGRHLLRSHLENCLHVGQQWFHGFKTAISCCRARARIEGRDDALLHQVNQSHNVQTGVVGIGRGFFRARVSSQLEMRAPTVWGKGRMTGAGTDCSSDSIVSQEFSGALNL